MLRRRFVLLCALAFCLAAGSPSESAAQPEPEGASRMLLDSTFFMQPVWSPNGRQLAVTGSGYGGIWLADRDGGRLRQVTNAPAAGFDMSWSPDGAALLSRVARYEGRKRFNAVATFDVKNGDRQLLTDYRSQMPALPQWSPDGQRVVLPGSSSRAEVLKTDRPAAPTSRADVLYASGKHIQAARPETGSVRSVARSQEGRRVLNVTPSPDGNKVAYEVMGGPLYVMDVDGANRVKLGRGGDPSWSPDGEWITFVRTEDNGYRITASELYAARADGSARLQLTHTSDRVEMNPAWSPTGDAIAFDDHEGRVWLLPIAY